MSGYLYFDQYNRSSLITTRRVYQSGKYHVVVLLESRECLYANSNASLDGYNSDRGIAVTSGKAAVVVGRVSLWRRSSRIPLREVCSFKYGAKRVEFRTENVSLPLQLGIGDGICGRSACLLAEKCRLVEPSLQPLKSIQERFSEGVKLRMLFLGSSRTECFAGKVDRWLRSQGQGGSRIPLERLASAAETHVTSLELNQSTFIRFGSILEAVGLCSDSSRIELIYVCSSLWWNPGVRQTVGNRFTSLREVVMIAVRELVHAIAERCPDQRRYRLFWISNTVNDGTSGDAYRLSSHGIVNVSQVPGVIWSILRNLSDIHHNTYIPLGEASLETAGVDAELASNCLTGEGISKYLGLLLQATFESFMDDPLAQVQRIAVANLTHVQIKRAVEVGRDEFRIGLFWTVEGSVNTIRIVFLNPHNACGRECLYRYYIIGPSRFGGFLTPCGSGSKCLVARREIQEPGAYRLVVLLESLGRNRSSPLPLWMSSHTNTSFLNESSGKLRLVGFIASNPDVSLVIDKLPPLNDKSARSKPVCSFQPDAEYISFRTVDRGRDRCAVDALNMSDHCLMAENCRLQWPSLSTFEQGLSESFGPKQTSARMLFIGTSRVEMLFRGMSKVLAKPPYDEANVWKLRSLNETSIDVISEILFIETHPNASDSTLAGLLKHNACQDPSRLELIYFSVGIHETRLRNHDLIHESPILYADLLKAELAEVVIALNHVCPRREMYRIVWMSQPATHVFIKLKELPKAHERNDLIATSFFWQLQQSTYFLLETRRLYRQLSLRDESAYFPWNEMTLGMFDEGPVDHLHYWGMNENSAFSKMLLYATLEKSRKKSLAQRHLVSSA